jgi:hypothetical protein
MLELKLHHILRTRSPALQEGARQARAPAPRIPARKASRYRQLARNWIQTTQGRNYWTSAPDFCDRFRPGQLTFYYRDYSAKTRWTGATNGQGVPLVAEGDGPPFHHPVTVAQKALGHWNAWQQSDCREDNEFQSFLNLAAWLCESQDALGGWAIASLRRAGYLVPYSAMAQGQIISVLVRAFSVAGASRYLNAARRGVGFMLTPIDCGGTSRTMREGFLLEEYPAQKRDGVLNGWINAIFGLYDYLLVQSDASTAAAMNWTVDTLVACLPQYDLGFWSKYDLRGTIASPYYHNVHITQLKALELAFPEFQNEFMYFRQRFEKYSASRFRKFRALANKTVQKAMHPPATVLRLPVS